MLSRLSAYIPEVEGHITVAKSGGDFDNLEDALAAAVARTCIVVYPGIYVENNPLVIPDYVTIKTCGEQATTRIEAANAGADLFTSANFVIIDGLSLANVSGAGAWVVQIAAADAMIFEDCVIFQCSNGFRTNHANATLTLRDIFYLSILGNVTACCVCNNAGNITSVGGRAGVGSTITTIFEADGANAITTVQNFLTFETGVTTAIQADNGARSVFVGCSLVGMQDGLVAQGGSDTRLVSTSIFLAQQDAIRVPNVGSGTNVGAQGLTTESSTRYDMNILSASAIVSGYGQASLDQMYWVNGAQFTAMFVDLKEDDEGVNIAGELHVGTPEQGTESVFGGGDSYTRGMEVWTYNPSGPVWTDVSAAARSASGSTFSFPATALNNAIYIGSSLQAADYLLHYGMKISQTVAAVLGGGAFALEYYNGASWVGVNHMSTLSGDPYTQYAKQAFLRTGSEQIRYPKAFLSSWTKNDPGMGLTRFWFRLRVSSAVTTVPVYQQFKLHTNRTELNADGMQEFFGAARPVRELISHIVLATAVVGSSPANASVAFTTGTTLSLTRNQFNDNQVHSFGQEITIPTGLDTSIPVTVKVIWYPDTNNSGDVELQAYYGQLAVGDLFNGTATETSVSDINTVAVNSQYQSRESTFLLDVSDLVPGELLVFRIERDATAGNADDTLAGNIVIAALGTEGTFWRA